MCQDSIIILVSWTKTNKNNILIMTYYHAHIERTKSICHSNQRQIDTVITARKYIDNNFQNDLDLNLLSQITSTSKYHLLRLFKRYYGLTPYQYLIGKRLQGSKDCLKNGMAVTETCYSVGFESPGSFSSFFKNKVGLSPSKFQKEQFSRSDQN